MKTSSKSSTIWVGILDDTIKVIFFKSQTLYDQWLIEMCYDDKCWVEIPYQGNNKEYALKLAKHYFKHNNFITFEKELPQQSQSIDEQIEQLKDEIDNLESVVYEECTDENEDYFDESMSSYYPELCKAREELNSLIESQKKQPISNVKEELSKQRKQQKQVDFDMLKETIERINNTNDLTLGQFKNLQLFFELLSKSSSFAHKSHKELSK